MARVQGGGHSDAITGNLGGVCFRGYRASNIVSSARRNTVAKPRTKTIGSPLEVPGLVARYSADKLVSLVAPPALILTPEEMMTEPGEILLGPPVQLGTVYSWGDQVGRCGTLVQASAGSRPKLFDADENRNNKPYIESDGINDMLAGPALALAIPQPFEIWMIASEPTTPAGAIHMLRLSAVGTGGLRFFVTGIDRYIMSLTADYIMAYPVNTKVRLWRCVFNTGGSFGEWNGQQQVATGNVGAGSLQQLRAFGYSTASNCAAFKCFEIDIFDGIIAPTWRALLQNWLMSEYNMPA